jgi:restriction endonuclease S subunit
MFEDKASKKDMEQMKVSLDPNRALNIFNDMRQLFDVTMTQIKAYIEKEKETLREGFQYVLKEQS